jgi:hypothetical protein
MYLTMEVRWFYPGALPQQLVAWLDNVGCLPAAQPPRTDHYLRLPGQPALGIKLREGNIEVKQRLDGPRQVSFGPRAVGRAARWRKWSFPLAPVATPLERLLVPSSAWIAVEKERRLARYRLAGGREAATVSFEVPLELGCEFELSSVRAGGKDWWSICFEAFGWESVLERALLAVAAQVLRPGWPLTLEIEHSLGYPALLARFAGPVDPPNY